MKNTYWDIDSMEMLNIVDEEYIFNNINKGQKTKLNVHVHSTYNKKFPKLIVGNEYYIQVNHIMEMPKYTKCIITDIRSGVVFYKFDSSFKEEWIEEFSTTHLFMEPVEINVKLSSKYYEIVGSSGKMKVNYLID